MRSEAVGRSGIEGTSSEYHAGKRHIERPVASCERAHLYFKAFDVRGGQPPT